jgi:hypothetical protein
MNITGGEIKMRICPDCLKLDASNPLIYIGDDCWKCTSCQKIFTSKELAKINQEVKNGN